jgi:hypothetical protein
MSEKKETGLNISHEDLKSLLTEVIREAKRPQIIETPKESKEMIEAMELAKIANKKAMKANCTHQRDDGKFNFGGQRGSDGIIRFICGTCFGVFSPEDPQYNHFLRYVKRDFLGNARQLR